VNVPRPLLVLVLVIVILGVASCGVGVIRGRMDAAGPTPAAVKQFDGVGESVILRKDVTFTGDCPNDPGDLTVAVSGTCQTVIEPRFLRSQKLKVTPSGGNVVVTVSQKIRGETKQQSDTVNNGDLVDVAVAGTSPVTIAFSCICSLIFSG